MPSLWQLWEKVLPKTWGWVLSWPLVGICISNCLASRNHWWMSVLPPLPPVVEILIYHSIIYFIPLHSFEIIEITAVVIVENQNNHGYRSIQWSYKQWYQYDKVRHRTLLTTWPSSMQINRHRSPCWEDTAHLLSGTLQQCNCMQGAVSHSSWVG